MNKFILILLSSTLMLSGYAWSDPATSIQRKEVKTKKCVFPKSRKRAPSWLCSATHDNLTVSAVGSSAKSGAGTEFMEQMAATEARAKLAQQLNGAVTQKIIAEGNSAKPDTALIQKITRASLEGTRIIDKAYAPNGSVYVLIGLNKTDSQNLSDKVAEDYLKRK